jgi:hypothetical protein
MLHAQGYATLSTPEGLLQECDTFTCHHCQMIVHVAPRCSPSDLGGHCRICDKLICPACAAKGNCDPWERKMDRFEARQAFLRSAGLA